MKRLYLVEDKRYRWRHRRKLTKRGAKRGEENIYSDETKERVRKYYIKKLKAKVITDA
jgi:replicative superfamily II helicase